MKVSNLKLNGGFVFVSKLYNSFRDRNQVLVGFLKNAIIDLNKKR